MHRTAHSLAAEGMMFGNIQATRERQWMAISCHSLPAVCSCSSESTSFGSDGGEGCGSGFAASCLRIASTQAQQKLSTLRSPVACSVQGVYKFHHKVRLQTTLSTAVRWSINLSASFSAADDVASVCSSVLVSSADNDVGSAVSSRTITCTRDIPT